MIIITIVEYPSMPGRYRYSTLLNGRPKVHWCDCGTDPSAAAALAVEVAISHKMNCTVMAPQVVMDLIPNSLNIK